MNSTKEAPLVKGGQGRDAESLLDSARFIVLVSVAAFVGALVAGLLP